MLKETEIISALRDDTTYNYYDLAKTVYEKQLSTLQEPTPLTNTVELFAFGDYSHYRKYQSQFIEMDATLMLKLIKLTILSMVQDHEGGNILFLDMNDRYLIQQAVDHYCELSEAPVCHLLENTFFSMIDDSLILIKFDHAKDRINVYKANLLRDCYDASMFKLVVLSEEDIPRSAGNSYGKLEKWLQQVREAQRKAITNK